MSTTNLFKCYAQDYATLPSSQGAEMTCPILGGQYDKARLKFMAAKEPPIGEPAMFVVRIKGDFTEYPTPQNINDITKEMRDCFVAHGIEALSDPKVCWHYKANDMWMDDEHIPLSEQDAYAELMDKKAYQSARGEALVAFEISAEQRDKLPAVRQAIDGLIAQREAERKTRYA